jgi:hypothetical protein
MGWQRWLSLDATFVQPIQSLSGWMAMTQLMALGFINALSAALLAQRI